MKPNTILLAEVDRPRGLKGEVVATLHTDGHERLDTIENVLIVSPGGASRSVRLEGWKRRGVRAVLKLSGINSVDEARTLVGSEIHISRADFLDKAPEGKYFAYELEGLKILNLKGEELGSVHRVICPGDQALLEIKGGAREFVIPLVRAICVKIEPEKGSITIDPPDGLIELNAV